MKRSFCLIFSFLSLWSAGSATAKKQSVVSTTPVTATRGISKPTVDPRVELMSIVARLAGLREYQTGLVAVYTDSVDRWFAPYKEHPAVRFVKKLRKRKGLGYNALPIMGVYLTELPTVEARLPLTPTQPEDRWGIKDGEKFIRLLGDFYRDTRCEEFFAGQDSLFRAVEKVFEPVFDEVDTEWFTRFFGEETRGGMVPIVGMALGQCNYGGDIVYPDSTVDQYAFMGSWGMQGGKPVFQREWFRNTIVHEFSHSFVNPVQESTPELKEPADALFETQAEVMRQAAYGSGWTVVNETFVRAAVIRYLMEHADSATVARAMREEIGRHFVWMPEAVELLGEYEADRDRYPDYRSFMPRVVEWCGRTAAQFDTILARRAAEEERYKESCMKVVAIEPFGNGAQNVDPELTEITIRFDRPLVGRGISFNYGPGGETTFLPISGWKYSEDKTAFTFQTKLEPGHDYEFVVLRDLVFVGQDGKRLYKDYLVRFRTRDK